MQCHDASDYMTPRNQKRQRESTFDWHKPVLQNHDVFPLQFPLGKTLGCPCANFAQCRLWRIQEIRRQPACCYTLAYRFSHGSRQKTLKIWSVNNFVCLTGRILKHYCTFNGTEVYCFFGSQWLCLLQAQPTLAYKTPGFFHKHEPRYWDKAFGKTVLQLIADHMHSISSNKAQSSRTAAGTARTARI